MMKWISVEERLPEDMEFGCIVYYENDVTKAVTNTDAYFEHKGFCIFDKNSRARPVVGVTHWMPLPEPPEGE